MQSLQLVSLKPLAHHEFGLRKTLLGDRIEDTGFMTPLLNSLLSLPSQLPVFRRALLSRDYLQNRQNGEVSLLLAIHHASSHMDIFTTGTMKQNIIHCHYKNIYVLKHTVIEARTRI